MSSHSEIVEKFSTRQPNKRHQEQVVWSGSRIYCTNDLIFSYGSHFPMAKYLGERDGKSFFIKNNDKYSSSTSAHQSKVRKHCSGPDVSRCKLSKYIHFEDLEMEHVHLWRTGIYKHMWQDTKTGLFYDDVDYRSLDLNDPDPTDPFMPLDQNADVSVPGREFKLVNLQRRVCVFVKPCKPFHFGSFKAYKRQDGEQFNEGTYSVEQILVLKIDDKYLLSTKDNIIELVGKPKTIAQALKMKHKKNILKGNKDEIINV